MDKKTTKIKVRFAPSPTGFMHVGSLRTALYNYLFARQSKGIFILRIEDTDRARLVPEAEQNIIDTLNLFDLKPDEGPFRQSERLDIYKHFAQKLEEQNLAYRDDGALRFRMPKEGASEFTDIIRGHISIDNKNQEDFVIIKSDGWPTYNFAHLADDHEMGVTHVIRGEEFIPSMPKYLALHRAFGWEIPQYAHLPLLLSKTRSKLSKREGDVAVNDYLAKGYLKEALINFVALLGWHPSKSEKEIFSLPELVEVFRLEDVQKGGAIFDLDKLNWFNHTWSQKLYGDKIKDHPLYKKIRNDFKNKFDKIDGKIFDLLWPHLLERQKSPDQDVISEFGYFFSEPNYDSQILIWKKSDKTQTKISLENIRQFLQSLPDEKWGRGGLEEELKKFIQENNFDTGTVLWPLRVALSGQEKSMGPFDIMDIYKRGERKDTVFERIDRAINSLNS